MVGGSIPDMNPSIVSRDFACGLCEAMLNCHQGREPGLLLGADLGDEIVQEDIKIPGSLANLCSNEPINTACAVTMTLMLAAAPEGWGKGYLLSRLVSHLTGLWGSATFPAFFGAGAWSVEKMSAL